MIRETRKTIDRLADSKMNDEGKMADTMLGIHGLTNGYPFLRGQSKQRPLMTEDGLKKATGFTTTTESRIEMGKGWTAHFWTSAVMQYLDDDASY